MLYLIVFTAVNHDGTQAPGNADVTLPALTLDYIRQAERLFREKLGVAGVICTNLIPLAEQ